MIERSAVLFLTHNWTSVHTLRFQRLRRQTAGIADCYVLYQSATDEAPDAARRVSEGAIHVFQPSELPNRLGYAYLTPAGIVPGCTHYPLIDFFKCHSYRHYWLIEGDVEFSGDWATLLHAGSASEAGLLGSHVRCHRDSLDFVWWDSLSAPFPQSLKMPWRPGKLRRAFLPVFRISSDAIRLIDRLHSRGCTGHHEVLLPTAIFNAGLDVVDLSALNTQKPFYRGTEQDPVDDVSKQSTHRYRPEITLAEFVQTFAVDTIYHPVKGEWTFDGTNVVVASASGLEVLSLDACRVDCVRVDAGPAWTVAARTSRLRPSQRAGCAASTMQTEAITERDPARSLRRSTTLYWRITASHRYLMRSMLRRTTNQI